VEFELKRRVPELERRVKVMLQPKDETDERNAIVEVRADTGGEEAALFAEELFAMYLRYAELRAWKIEILDISKTGLGCRRPRTSTSTSRRRTCASMSSAPAAPAASR